MSLIVYLFFFSGPPGCGKSTLARAIAQKHKAPFLSRDHIQGFLFQRNLITTNTVDGYLWILEQARVQLSLGISCVLDAVFPRQEFREIAENYAYETSTLFVPIYCYCSNKDLWRSRWMQRAEGENESHWMKFSWDDVERIDTQFEPWKHEHLIELDAVHSHETNLYKLVQSVKARASG